MKFYKENIWATTPFLLFIFYWTLITPSFKEIMYWSGIVFAMAIVFLYITTDRRNDVDYDGSRKVSGSKKGSKKE